MLTSAICSSGGGGGGSSAMLNSAMCSSSLPIFENDRREPGRFTTDGRTVDDTTLTMLGFVDRATLPEPRLQRLRTRMQAATSTSTAPTNAPMKPTSMPAACVAGSSGEESSSCGESGGGGGATASGTVTPVATSTGKACRTSTTPPRVEEMVATSWATRVAAAADTL